MSESNVSRRLSAVSKALISTESWEQMVNEAARWIQGSPLTVEQMRVAKEGDKPVRVAVRAVFNEDLEDAYYLRDLGPTHWRGISLDKAQRMLAIIMDKTRREQYAKQLDKPLAVDIIPPSQAE